MNIGTDALELKKIMEAGGLFKPATPEQVANRLQDPEWDEASLKEAMRDEFEDIEHMGIAATMHPEDPGIVGFIIGEDGDIMDDEEVEKYLQNALYAVKRISRVVAMGKKKFEEYKRRGGRFLE